MTKEAFRNLLKAMGALCVVVGGLGSILCVPFAVTSDLGLISVAGLYFVAGGVMMTGGLITVSLLIQPDH